LWRRLAIAVAVLLAAVLAVVAAGLFIPGGTPLRCPDRRVPSYETCGAVGGRVVYVQGVDPDGDGDMHVALLSRQSLTYPAISVVKFERRVRPPHAPAIGSWMTAVGERYTGTHDDRNLRVERYRR
jgi:hypothetical protein